MTKACLALAHGNAGTERSFSEVASIMRKERPNLECYTLNAILSVKSYLRVKNQNCTNIELEENLLSFYREAYRTYEARQKKQQMERKSEEEVKEIAGEIGIYLSIYIPWPFPPVLGG